MNLCSAIFLHKSSSVELPSPQDYRLYRKMFLWSSLLFKMPFSRGVLQNQSKVNKRKNIAKVAKPSCLAALHQQLLSVLSALLAYPYFLKNAAAFVVFVLFFWLHLVSQRCKSFVSWVAQADSVPVALCWFGGAESRMIGKMSCGNSPWCDL